MYTQGSGVVAVAKQKTMSSQEIIKEAGGGRYLALSVDTPDDYLYVVEKYGTIKQSVFASDLLKKKEKLRQRKFDLLLKERDRMSPFVCLFNQVCMDKFGTIPYTNLTGCDEEVLYLNALLKLAPAGLEAGKYLDNDWVRINREIYNHMGWEGFDPLAIALDLTTLNSCVRGGDFEIHEDSVSVISVYALGLLLRHDVLLRWNIDPLARSAIDFVIALLKEMGTEVEEVGEIEPEDSNGNPTTLPVFRGLPPKFNLDFLD